ncbi:MAG: four helix bundle protein [FCB group bacterium]|nr:four helix bundle protein [FCB group bacterium]
MGNQKADYKIGDFNWCKLSRCKPCRSKADFRSKIRICESEASETLFWIDVILAVGWVSVNDLNQLRMECGEILALFTVIGNNTISNKRK